MKPEIAYWHVHRDILIERLTQSVQNRINFIRRWKPLEEIETRLRLMKPASRAASKALAVYDKAESEAQAVYDNKATPTEAWAASKAVYDKAESEAWAQVEAFHKKECPDCPWNGETIFP